MNPILIFGLIVVFGLIPWGILCVWALFRRTIVFRITIIMFLTAMICAFVGFCICQLGFKSLIWIVPVCTIAIISTNYFYVMWVLEPVNEIKRRIEQLAYAKKIESTAKFKALFRNEFVDVIEAIKLLEASNEQTTEFANAIAKGDFGKDFKLLSDDDNMGKSLLNMRDSLRESKNQEEQRAEEQKRIAWATSGIATFGELMRQQNSDINELSRTFVSKLTDYIHVVQGGVFMLNDDDREHIKYVLTGAVAFSRQKQMEKEFELGIGLIGQCAYEQKTIYMSEVPENYIEITSGLGEANPRYILIVPAILNGTVYAVIELASFKPIAKHKIEFVEKLGETLASSLSMVKVNENTQRLLKESKANEEQLAEQQEVLKQNMEELQATQEEMARKEDRLREIATKHGINLEIDF
ncbi:MAG: GAF domain-containing protein [Salinivirgaceae bacterium]|nr:GAF domain-containing protein [Salinivirgaceae bacterium]